MTAVGEQLHKVCGALEIARDLVDRSQAIYAASGTADEDVVDLFDRAIRALFLVMETLRREVQAERLVATMRSGADVEAIPEPAHRT